MGTPAFCCLICRISFIKCKIGESDHAGEADCSKTCKKRTWPLDCDRETMKSFQLSNRKRRGSTRLSGLILWKTSKGHLDKFSENTETCGISVDTEMLKRLWRM